MKTSSMIGAVLGTIFRVFCIVAVVCVIYRGALLCYDYGYRVFTEPAVSSGTGRTVIVTIPQDMSAWEMGKLFEEKGLVEDSKLFVLQYYLSEYLKDIQPGTFELTTAMTAEEMMRVMATPVSEENEKG